MIMRVFPRKTKATPCDKLVRINCGPELWDEADEVHISVAFTWDLPRAEWLAEQWKHVAPVKIGGTALNEPGGDFIPGMYLKKGYVITSRGCPNRCWFCAVPKREGGTIRELPIVNGYNVLDDNLLACSPRHIEDVFLMLGRQGNEIEFTGGIDSKLLNERWAKWLYVLKPKQLFIAYDEPGDRIHMWRAGQILQDAGFKVHPHSHSLRCYVLCGYPHYNIQSAEARMKDTVAAGFTPMAMLWKDETGKQDREWRKFQREWTRPAIIYAKDGICHT